MKVLVFGSRTFEDADVVNAVLDGVLAVSDFLTVVEGGARGADRLAGDWAKRNAGRVGHKRVMADWDKHGGRAGPMRNGRMLREEPDVAFGFIDKELSESHGSLDMATKARKAGVRTYVIRRYA